MTFNELLDKYRAISFSEHGNERYILDLILSSITVSLKTPDSVDALPDILVNDKYV